MSVVSCASYANDSAKKNVSGYLNELKSSRSDKPQVLYYPAGNHYIDSIVLSGNVAIRGDGSNITYLYVKGGVHLNGKDVRLDGFTLIGEGAGTGLTLENNFRVLANDVQIENYQLGMLVTCDEGYRCWANTFRDLYVYGGVQGFGSHKKGEQLRNGVELRYLGKKQGVRWQGNGSMTSNRFFGGRIATRGTPLYIDGANSTQLFGTYIDIHKRPLYMTKRSSGLQLFGVFLDRSAITRKNNLPVIVLESPSENKLRAFGDHYMFDMDNVRDSEGRSVNKHDITRVPDRY